MKQRFTSLDVKVIAHELSYELCTLRLSNVYDLSSRIFLVRFAKPDLRRSLVIESGFRCHLTSFTRATAAEPSAFVNRLRKFLKTRRVTSVAQVGTDRIIDIQFSDGQYHLFLEFYAAGNIILTDGQLSVLALLRTIPEGIGQEPLRVGLSYSLENRQNYHGIPELTRERVKDGLLKPVAKGEKGDSNYQKKSKKKPEDALRKAITTCLTEFTPGLVDHALKIAHFDASITPEAVLESDSMLDKLMLGLREAQKVTENVCNSARCKGYILGKSSKDISSIEDGMCFKSNEDRPNEKLTYEAFQAFIPQGFKDSTGSKALEFESFNETIDEFFSSIESQKLESRLSERKENAKRKLANARSEYEKRLDGLQQVQELNIQKAQAIEVNVQRVQEAISAVNSLLAQGMDWQNVARLIKVEKERHNVVAEIIKLPLKLYENTITLSLAEESFEDEADFEGDETASEVSDSEDEQNAASRPPKQPAVEDKRLFVDVDLALSPWSNARQYYDQKKFAALKERKTVQSSQRALKNTERKIDADLKKGLKQEKDVMRPQRNVLWFEKFIYFISSEGYLAVGGKDPQQTEILYQRHLRKGDVYIHADLQGATSIIVKNKLGKADDPLPLGTLSQAGTLAVATSSAWDSKAIMSAWWVRAEQVSKSAPNGDFLQQGNFNIQGEKNFLPPAQLLLGFGMMFRISEESKAHHLKHRFIGEAPEEVNKKAAAAEDVREESSTLPGEDGSISIACNSISNSSLEDIPILSQEDVVDEAVTQNNQRNSRHSDSEPENPLQIGDPQASPVEICKAGSFRAKPEERDDAAKVLKSDLEDSVENSSRGSVDNDKENSSDLDTTQITNTTSTNPSVFETPASSAPSTSNYNSSLPTPQKPPPQVRGKRGKRQKQKFKYAEQDPEDRALAMRLLGSATAQEKAKTEAEAKIAREQELAEQKERRRKQHALAAERGRKAEEERRKKLEAEGGVGYDEDESETSAAVDLDTFVGAPLPGDDILDSLVVCGPWDAIGARCRWRVKLQPGATKKGKAVKEILERWNRIVEEGEKKKRLGSGDGNEVMAAEEKIRKREGELIRAIRDVEVIGVVPVGKVRIVMGGGEKGGKAGATGGRRGGKGARRK